MISKVSCDTEDWSNAAQYSVFFKCIKIGNSYNSPYNGMFYDNITIITVFDQINPAEFWSVVYISFLFAFLEVLVAVFIFTWFLVSLVELL